MVIVVAQTRKELTSDKASLPSDAFMQQLLYTVPEEL
jgi:hypothetical protein